MSGAYTLPCAFSMQLSTGSLHGCSAASRSLGMTLFGWEAINCRQLSIRNFELNVNDFYGIGRESELDPIIATAIGRS